MTPYLSMTPLGSRTDLHSTSPHGSLHVTPSASASWSTLSASVSPSISASTSSSASTSVSPLWSVSGHISSYPTPTASASATTSRSADATPTAVPTVYYNTVYTTTETSQAGIIIGSTSLGTLFVVVAGATYYLRRRCRLNTDIYKEPGEDTQVKTVDPETGDAPLKELMNKVIDQVVVESEEISNISVIEMPNIISDA